MAYFLVRIHSNIVEAGDFSGSKAGTVSDVGSEDRTSGKPTGS